MDVILRTATFNDKTAIENLFMEMLKSIYQTETVKGYEADYLNRFFADSEDRIIVAELEHIIIGYISIELKREDVPFAYLDDFCVQNEYRSRGIGTQLLQLAQAYANESDMSAILFHVESSNTSAQRLYERNGYEIYKTDGSRILMKKDSSIV